MIVVHIFSEHTSQTQEGQDKNEQNHNDKDHRGHLRLNF